MDLKKIAFRVAVPMEETNLEPERDATFKRLFENFGPKITYFKSPPLNVKGWDDTAFSKAEFSAFMIKNATFESDEDLKKHGSIKSLLNSYLGGLFKSGVYRSDAINFFVCKREDDFYSITAEWFAHDIGHIVFRNDMEKFLKFADDMADIIKLNSDVEILNDDPSLTKSDVMRHLDNFTAQQIACAWVENSLHPKGAAHSLNLDKNDSIFDLVYDYMISYVKTNGSMPKHFAVNPIPYYYGRDKGSNISFKEPKNPIARIIPGAVVKKSIESLLESYMRAFEDESDKYFKQNLGKIVII